MVPAAGRILHVISILRILFSRSVANAFAFATSSLPTVHTTVINRFNVCQDSLSFKMTEIFSSRWDVDDACQDEYDENDNGDDGSAEGSTINFDLDSAREMLESLVGIEQPVEGELGEHSTSSQPRKTTLIMGNIQLLKDDKKDPQQQHSMLFLSDAGASIASSPSMLDVVEPPPLSVVVPRQPPMTAIERKRRLAEIEILKRLLQDTDMGSDQVVADLCSSWYAERGPQAEAILKKAEMLMVRRVREQLEAERLMRKLIEEYGIYFVEPISRLAILYFHQGRMEESLALDKIVLAIKPWHVGALSHIVMVYEAMGDFMSARSWARFRLPSVLSVGNNKRRVKWVERAISDATRLLEQGEINYTMAFGEPDSNWIEKHPSVTNRQLDIIADDDSWQ